MCQRVHVCIRMCAHSASVCTCTLHTQLRAFVAFLLQCYLTRQVLASAIRKLNMQASISGIPINVLFLFLSHLQLMIHYLQQVVNYQL